jgi:hypothetical protein
LNIANYIQQEIDTYPIGIGSDLHTAFTIELFDLLVVLSQFQLAYPNST